jgi:2-methylcitrate dehydratase PrpD
MESARKKIVGISLQRRSLLQATLLAGAGVFLPRPAFGQSEDGTPAFDASTVPFTQILSRFIAKTSYDQLPADAVMAAKRGIVDTLAVTYGAANEDVSRIVQRYARTSTSREEATVLGGGFKTNARLAAYVNGTMSHALDYDNVIHVGNVWMGHPSVVVLPAVLAVAEQQNLSGKELLLGYALGLEIYTKVGLLMGNKPYSNGWHNTSYIGAMAAAGAVARLLNLDEKQIAHAFGIAGSEAGGLRQNFGTMTKPLHAGIGARTGVEAAELAQAGLTATEHIFEGPLGFRSVFLGTRGAMRDVVVLGDESLTADQFASRLGAPWNIASPGMAYKICASCRSSHYGLEAGLEFRDRRPFDLQQLAEIECHVSNEMGQVLFYHQPKTGLEGKFSLEYVLARTLLDGVPKTTDFTAERVTDPAATTLMKKMRWQPFQQAPKDPGYPTFVFKSVAGQDYRTKIEHLTGEPERPVSNELLLGKFDDLSSPVLSSEKRARTMELILGLENVASVRTLTKELSPS